VGPDQVEDCHGTPGHECGLDQRTSGQLQLPPVHSVQLGQRCLPLQRLHHPLDLHAGSKHCKETRTSQERTREEREDEESGSGGGGGIGPQRLHQVRPVCILLQRGEEAGTMQTARAGGGEGLAGGHSGRPQE